MGIIVENPGILTTVQDEGRFGFQQFGVSPAGPMDTQSFYLANILAGNKRSEGVLEMTFSGPTLRFEKDNIIAITGASMSPCVNGNPIPMYQAVLVRAGETLSFGMTNGNGSRAYLAFAGGLDVPLVMGSKSTLMRNQLGGIEGRKLEKGDSIGFVSPKTTLPNMEMRKFEPEVFPKKELTLRVVTGPQDTNLTVWDAGFKGKSRLSTSATAISLPTESHLARSRYLRMGSRSSCWQTGRARAATARSEPSFPWICQN